MGKNKEVVDRVWEMIDGHNLTRLEEVLTPDVEFRLGSQVFRGVAEFRAMAESWFTAFPDMRHEVKTEVESGDNYISEIAIVGTHKGTMHSPQGDVPATGRKINMLSCDYIKVDKGKIASWHAYPDMPGLMAQMTG